MTARIVEFEEFRKSQETAGRNSPMTMASSLTRRIIRSEGGSDRRDPGRWSLINMLEPIDRGGSIGASETTQDRDVDIPRPRIRLTAHGVPWNVFN